jgi:L-threonylcarbamoyladenylate synthase|tara:strand:+ start:532 stop:1149 length:618 start_codon:yes stop_codon:yes gene_type:complete
LKSKQNIKILLEKTIHALNNDEPCILPTDTFYALSVRANSSLAVKRLFEIKKRDLNKPVPILISSLNDISNYCDTSSETLQKLANKFWPGPLTIVLPLQGGIPKEINNDSGFLGVRVPDHSFAVDLIKDLGQPITGTSANISNFPPSKDINEIKSTFGSNISNYVDIPCGKETLSSTVIKIDNNNVIDILREGPITIDDINKEIS